MRRCCASVGSIRRRSAAGEIVPSSRRYIPGTAGPNRTLSLQRRRIAMLLFYLPLIIFEAAFGMTPKTVPVSENKKTTVVD
jgi:hypothetical protein